MSARVSNQLFDELVAVHAMIRRDLARVLVLAEDVAGGSAPEDVRERVGELRASSILWQLKTGCLRHCRFVHSHHSLEDRAVFPSLRRVDPQLGPVIDRLEAEHRQVAVAIAEVETAANELGGDDAGAARERVVTALNRLGELLLEHLEFEERSLKEPLGRMRTWAG